ncbi:12809_t:CDS:1, partial [Ambispora leptoticha]
MSSSSSSLNDSQSFLLDVYPIHHKSPQRGTLRGHLKLGRTLTAKT